MKVIKQFAGITFHARRGTIAPKCWYVGFRSKVFATYLSSYTTSEPFDVRFSRYEMSIDLHRYSFYVRIGQ